MHPLCGESERKGEFNPRKVDKENTHAVCQTSSITSRAEIERERPKERERARESPK
jgi:hypothetical protein